MKNYLTIILLLLIITGCDTVKPVLKSTLAENPDREVLYLADPFILSDDTRYYLYGTSSEDGFQVFQSDDLESWSRSVGHTEGFSLRKEDVWGDKMFWAPEVYKYKGRYYMFYTVEEHIAVALSDSPKGPFTQTIREPLIKEEKAIDPHVLFASDGRKYLYYVKFNKGNEIWSAELNDDLLSIKPGTERFCLSVSQDWEKSSSHPVANINEGPFVLEKDGFFYLTYSANHYASQDYGVGFAVSKSPEGPWKKSSNNPILQKNNRMTGTGHHSIFTDHDGNLNIIYHSHYDDIFIHPRKLSINRLHLNGRSLKIGETVNALLKN